MYVAASMCPLAACATHILLFYRATVASSQTQPFGQPRQAATMRSDLIVGIVLVFAQHISVYNRYRDVCLLAAWRLNTDAAFCVYTTAEACWGCIKGDECLALRSRPYVPLVPVHLCTVRLFWLASSPCRTQLPHFCAVALAPLVSAASIFVFCLMRFRKLTHNETGLVKAPPIKKTARPARFLHQCLYLFIHVCTAASDTHYDPTHGR